MIILIALMTFISPLAGGLLALRFKNHYRLFMAFSAGAVIGMSLLDLLPQSLGLGRGQYNPAMITSVVTLGFIVYMLLDRFALLHKHINVSGLKVRAWLGAGSFSVHSFFDGVIIGLAYQTTPSMGIIIATGVIAHNFSDGINTVIAISKNNGSIRSAYKWLLANSIAPVAGVMSTYLFSLPIPDISLVLALFCGFFLYMGSSDLLPESLEVYSRWSMLITLAGFATIYLALQISAL